MAIAVEKFTFNPFQENTFVVHDGVQCVIIDPGCYFAEEGEQLIRFINDNGLQPQAVLLTHAHLDHIFGCDRISKHFGIDVYMHEKDIFTLDLAERSANDRGLSETGRRVVNRLLEAGTVFARGNSGV